MKNINKKTINALRTYSNSFMQHNVIPGFKLNGSNPFTIEMFFCLSSNNSKSILYGQQGVFELGIDEGFIYFNAPNFCGFKTEYPNEVKVMANKFYSIAVTFDGANILLYMQGYNILTCEKVGIGNESSNHYDIGKDFNGYITSVRVYDISLKPEQILEDTTNTFTESSNCVAWLDFSQRQPIDRSKNHLNIWIYGNNDFNKSRVVNLVACTSFSGKGYCLLESNLKSAPTAYSIIGKIYLKRTDLKKMYVYSNSGDDKTSGFDITLDKIENGKFKLVFSAGASKISSSNVIESDQWEDFAVTVVGSNVCLYIDGIKDAEGTISVPIIGKTISVIGAKTIEGRPDYTVGFNGYIDYIAEFEDTLTNDKLISYIENPPFIFDKKIISIMLLDNVSANEIVYNKPIARVGDIEFILAENTNPMDCEKGVTYYIPKNEDPMWSTLTKEEQWELEANCRLSQTVTNKVFGSKEVGTSSMWMFGTTGLIRRRGRIHEVPMEEVGAADAVDIAAEVGAAQGGAFFSFNGMISGMIGLLESKVFWATVAASAGVAIVATVIAAELKKRPASNSTLQILSLEFDHNSDATIGSIHFRNNLSNAPESTKFKKSSISDQINMQGVFIPKLITNVKLNAVVKFKSDSGSSLTTKLIAKELDESTKVLGDITSEEFTILNEEEKTIEINIGVPDIFKDSSVTKKSNTWKWAFENSDDDSDKFIINSNYDIYTLLDTPKRPWKYSVCAYDNLEIEYIWTDVIDVVMSIIPKSTATTDIISCITTNLNNSSSFRYDTTRGASFYTDNTHKIKMNKYLIDRSSITRKPLNCTDCANIVAALCAAVGINCYTDIIVMNFMCNKIISIGCDGEIPRWMKPFYGGFSYHEVTLGEDILRRDIGIYDACLKIDKGDYPGGDNESLKVPYIATNYPFAETDEPLVNVPIGTAYKGNFYRERLVMDKERVNIGLMAYEPAGISNVITASSVMKDNIITEFKKSIRERFELDTFKDTALCYIKDYKPDFSGFDIVKSSSLSEDIGLQKIWQVTTVDNEELLVDIHVAENQKNAINVLVERLSKISNPDIVKNDGATDSYVSFTIYKNSVLFVRNNIVVDVFYGEKSFKIASDIDKQILSLET